MTELSGYARALLRYLRDGNRPLGYDMNAAIELRDAGLVEPWPSTVLGCLCWESADWMLRLPDGHPGYLRLASPTDQVTEQEKE
jgi:hypothetical protein